MTATWSPARYPDTAYDQLLNNKEAAKLVALFFHAAAEMMEEQKLSAPETLRHLREWLFDAKPAEEYPAWVHELLETLSLEEDELNFIGLLEEASLDAFYQLGDTTPPSAWR